MHQPDRVSVAVQTDQLSPPRTMNISSMLSSCPVIAEDEVLQTVDQEYDDDFVYEVSLFTSSCLIFFAVGRAL